MNRNIYKVLAIVLAIVAVIGLVSFFGGIRAVNAGAFICPAALAIVFWALYKRK